MRWCRPVTILPWALSAGPCSSVITWGVGKLSFPIIIPGYLMANGIIFMLRGKGN